MSATEKVRSYLTDEVRSRLFRPTAEASGMPGTVYTDPAFFGLERQITFSRNWVCVGIAQDLPNPGDQVPIDVAGIPILLIHGHDGVIRAFHNICRHRGAQLVPCQTRRNAVVCPYHAWAYALDGSLTRTPGFGGPDVNALGDLDLSQHGLLPVRLERWHHLLFVNLDAQAQALLDQLAPLLERWKDYDFSLLRHGSALRFEMNANWKLVIENFVERYHLPFVHPALNSVSSVKHSLKITDGDRFVGVGSRNFALPSVNPDRKLPVFPNLTQEQLTLAEYVAVFPNVMIGVHFNHVYVFIVQPVAVDRTRERFEFFFVGDEAMTDELAADREKISGFVGSVNNEDIDIVQRLHIGCQSPAMRGGVFSPVMEDTTHKFQRIVAERLLADAAAADGVAPSVKAAA